MHCTEDPSIDMRERARRIVMHAKGGLDGGTITGLRGSRVVTEPMSVERLARHGVPEALDLPFDSEALRALVVELAQLEID